MARPCARPVLGGEGQPDFRTFYYAAKAYEQGQDPYDLRALQRISGLDTPAHPFVYPPQSLILFQPIARLDFVPAYYLFLGLKLGALAALVFVWTRVAPTGARDGWALALMVLLGYRSAVLRDIREGNVSIFEQLLLWGGILLVMRRRELAGGTCVLLSSVFKLVTGALLPVLVVIRRTWRSLWILIALCSGWAAAATLLYSAKPALWRRFLGAVARLDERGNNCPSSLAFLRDVGDSVGIPAPTMGIVYVLFCCLVASALVWGFVATRRSRDVYPMLYLTVLGFAIAAPRLKNYSQIIVLLPTLHALSSMTRRRWYAVAGCALLWIPMIDYQALLLSAAAFGLALRWIWVHRHAPHTKIEPTLNPLRTFGL